MKLIPDIENGKETVYLGLTKYEVQKLCNVLLLGLDENVDTFQKVREKYPETEYSELMAENVHNFQLWFNNLTELRDKMTD